MSATLRVLFLGLVAGLTGCVSMGTYHALQDRNADLQAQLDQTQGESNGLRSDLGATQQSNDALNRNKTALEAQAADLEQSEADLASQDTELTGQKAALEKDREDLLRQAAEKQAQYDSVMGALNHEVSAGLLKITRYRNMLSLDVADEILFDSGKAALKPDGEAVLLEVGKAIAKSDKTIRVVGDTDNVPLGPDSAYASNWELSTARATTVVRYLQDQCGLDPTRLVAEGRGQWNPVAPNDTPGNRQKNRRIEIMLIDRGLIDEPEGGSPVAMAR
jgi:chemotaxis protein MotB